MRSASPIVRLCRVVVLGIVMAGASAAEVGRPVYGEHAPASPGLRDDTVACRTAVRTARRVAPAAPRLRSKTSAPRPVAAARWRPAPPRVPRSPIYLTRLLR